MEIGEVRITPLLPGSCPVCAARHRPEEPHDRDSLYYQNWFYKTHRRFPTWEDAMSHCDEKTRDEFKKMLARRGIPLSDSNVK